MSDIQHQEEEIPKCPECGAEAGTPQGFCNECAGEGFSNLDS